MFRRSRGARAVLSAGVLGAALALANMGSAPADGLIANSTTNWGLDRIDQRGLPLDGQYTPPADGAGVSVYLVDTGLDVANAQFADRAALGIDLTGTGVTDCADEIGVGHGTFVAGIAAGTTTGVAPKADLIEVQALGCTEGGSTMTRRQERRAVVRAAGWIRRNAVRPAVVNMSLAFPGSDSVDRAVRRLIASRIPVVAAAGNQGANACRMSPARVRSVITVAASTQRDRAWSGSNQGRCVDLFAPGKNITSVLSEGGVFEYEGVGATSWAAPYVTGAVAQYLQLHPEAGPATVQRALRQASTPGSLDGVRTGTPNALLFTGNP